MARDRSTTLGLTIAGVGWIVLAGDAAFTPFLLTPGNLAAVAALRSDIFSVAETTILSGFALAILGSLRSGFGALTKFFEAVLDRADAPRPAPAAPPHAPTVSIEPELVEPAPTAPLRPQGPPRKGNYVILDNGAVEVDTLLGTRIFASMEEARDYIR